MLNFTNISHPTAAAVSSVLCTVPCYSCVPAETMLMCPLFYLLSLGVMLFVVLGSCLCVVVTRCCHRCSGHFLQWLQICCFGKKPLHRNQSPDQYIQGTGTPINSRHEITYTSKPSNDDKNNDDNDKKSVNVQMTVSIPNATTSLNSNNNNNNKSKTNTKRVKIEDLESEDDDEALDNALDNDETVFKQEATNVVKLPQPPK